jgi:hypothetical protein
MIATTHDAVLERLDEYDSPLREHCATAHATAVVLDLRRSDAPRAAPSAWQRAVLVAPRGRRRRRGPTPSSCARRVPGVPRCGCA